MTENTPIKDMARALHERIKQCGGARAVEFLAYFQMLPIAFRNSCVNVRNLSCPNTRTNFNIKSLTVQTLHQRKLSACVPSILTMSLPVSCIDAMTSFKVNSCPIGMCCFFTNGKCSSCSSSATFTSMGSTLSVL